MREKTGKEEEGEGGREENAPSISDSGSLDVRDDCFGQLDGVVGPSSGEEADCEQRKGQFGREVGRRIEEG